MFAVIVSYQSRTGDCLLIPFEPEGETGKPRQCVYPTRHAADTVAKVMRQKNTAAKQPPWKQVLVAEIGK